MNKMKVLGGKRKEGRRKGHREGEREGEELTGMW